MKRVKILRFAFIAVAAIAACACAGCCRMRRAEVAVTAAANFRNVQTVDFGCCDFMSFGS